MTIEAECQICGHTFDAPDGVPTGALIRCPACGEEDTTFVGQAGLPPLEAYSDEQRKLIEAYPNLNAYLRPPGEGLDGDDEPDPDYDDGE